jgi:hypothetical protein
MSGTVYRLPEPEEHQRLLREEGHAAYVHRLVVQYGPFIASSYDLRLFRQVRSVFVGGKESDLDRLFIREMSKELLPSLQQKLIDELPRSYRPEVERWKNLHWWARLLLQMRS